MRKRTTQLFIPLAIAALMAGCSKDEGIDNRKQGDGPLVVVTADESSPSRTTLGDDGLSVKWAVGDELTVYMNDGTSVSSDLYDLYDESRIDANGKATFAGDLRWNGSGPHTFYAAYPYEDAQTPSAHPVTLYPLVAQNGPLTDFWGYYAAMVASPYTASGTDGEPAEVRFKFRHVFSMVELRLVVLGTDKQVVRQVEIFSTEGKALSVTDGTVDLTKSEDEAGFAQVTGGERYSSAGVAVTSNTTPIPNTTDPSFTTAHDAPTPATVFPVRILTLPGDFTGTDNLRIVVTTDKGVYTILKNGKLFLRGKSYISTLVLDPADAAPVPTDVWDGSVSQPADFAPGEYFTINSAAELAWLAQQVNGGEKFADIDITLMCDIDLAGREWPVIGAGSSSFNGWFEGLNHTIKGLKVTTHADATSSIGLFGTISVGGIFDLNVAGQVISDNNLNAGGICGYANNATIAQCSSSVNVTGKAGADNSIYTGGVCGQLSGTGSSMSYCSASGTVTGRGTNTGNSGTGGLAGYAGSEHFDNCSSYATVSGYALTGGLVGRMGGATSLIRDCRSYATVINKAAAAGGYVGCGGIVGYFDAGAIENCISAATITDESTVANGNYGIGGIAGGAKNAIQVAGCEFSGTVTGVSVINTAGIIGKYDGGGTSGVTVIARNCVMSGTVLSSNDYAAGIIGYLHGTAVVDGCRVAPSGLVKNTCGTKECYAVGIAGRAENNSVVRNCSNEGTVTIDKTGSSTSNVAGIVGYSYGATITACRNTGTISSAAGVLGSIRMAGISARNETNPLKVTACYNTGTFVNPNSLSNNKVVGGILGYVHGNAVGSTGHVTACYNAGTYNLTTPTEPSTYVRAIAGRNDGNIPLNGCFTDAAYQSEPAATLFSADWPSVSASAAWGVGSSDGSAGNYWFSIGAAPSTYPKLWWEK